MQLLIHCAVFVIEYAPEFLFGMFANVGTSRQLCDQIIMSKRGRNCSEGDRVCKIQGHVFIICYLICHWFVNLRSLDSHGCCHNIHMKGNPSICIVSAVLPLTSRAYANNVFNSETLLKLCAFK